MLEKNLSIVGKQLPYNLSAERSILGAILLDVKVFYAVEARLIPEDFFSHECQEIYRSMLLLKEFKGEISFITVQNDLKRRGKLESMAASYLATLMDESYTGVQIADHVRIVKEMASLRNLIESLHKLILECFDPRDRKPVELFDLAEQRILELSASKNQSGYKPLKHFLMDAVEQLTDDLQNKGNKVRLFSGLRELDELLYGFNQDDLIVIGARPRVGKTAFALCIANNMIKAGHKIGFASIEMSGKDITLRLLSIETGIPFQKLKRGQISAAELAVVKQASARLEGNSVFMQMDDSPAQTLYHIRSEARRLKYKENVSCIIIDYLQKIKPPRHLKDRINEVAEISNALKDLAKQLNIPIIALAQLNRESDKTLTFKPDIKHLAESSTIERDADVIMLLYRDILHNREADPCEAELLVKKHRNGAEGDIRLNFDGPTMCFSDYKGASSPFEHGVQYSSEDILG
jgi:replicative DNA helicase